MMSQPSEPSARSTAEERLGRSLLLLVFLIFCSFTIVIGWDYEHRGSGATVVQPSVASDDSTASPTSPAPVTATSPSAANTATSSPTGTVYETPTAVIPTPSSTPAETPTPTATLLERVISVESNLHSGQLEASLQYGDDAQSTVRIAFDLANGDQEPRMHFTYAYRYSYAYAGGQEIRHVEFERVVIGSRIWDRRLAAIWIEKPRKEDAMGMAARSLQRFLPNVNGAVEVMESDESPGMFRWYDAERDADVVLEVDPVTAVPIRLTEIDRGSGPKLVVTYTGWNTEVEIAAPGD